MKKGQTSMEAVGVVALVLFVFAAVAQVGVALQQETSERETNLDREIRCSDLAAAINGVYSSGPGASVTVELNGNFTVQPGLIWLGTTGYGCDIDRGAVNETVLLSKDTYTIVKIGDKVEIVKA
jgi:hypothetical protein